MPDRRLRALASLSVPVLVAVACGEGDRVVNTASHKGPAASTSAGGAGAGGDASLDGGGASGAEVCGNGLDDDGDGEVDEGCACDVGQVHSCFGGVPSQAGVGRCLWGQETCVATGGGELQQGAWGACAGWVGPAAEICGNGVDDDCDGVVDDGCGGGSGGAGHGGSGQGGVGGGYVAGGCAVARAAEIGCGRAYVWGDEHVTYDGWPVEVPFWEKAAAWLKEPGQCGRARTRALVEPALGQAMGVLKAAGLDVTTASLPDDPTGYDIVVLEMGGEQTTVAQGQAYRAWIEKGGALMALVVGSGEPHECHLTAPLLDEVGLSYHCWSPAPWGPVVKLDAFPAVDGLTPSQTPFENGRFVVESRAIGSTVVAEVAGPCPPL
jgi:hypothetical protein